MHVLVLILCMTIINVCSTHAPEERPYNQWAETLSTVCLMSMVMYIYSYTEGHSAGTKAVWSPSYSCQKQPLMVTDRNCKGSRFVIEFPEVRFIHAHVNVNELRAKQLYPFMTYNLQTVIVCTNRLSLQQLHPLTAFHSSFACRVFCEEKHLLQLMCTSHL